MKNILIIDDDIHISNMLKELLTKEGYAVSRAYSGTEAALAVSYIKQGSARPDLVLLDLMLPGLDGEDVLPLLKGIPVIIVSAKADCDHKAELLFGGAVDFVTKPFHAKELLARIAIHLSRHAAADTAETLSCGNISLQTDTHTAVLNDRPVRLTRTEYAILKLLMQNPSQVITKSQLLDRISMDTPDCTESSLKMHISNLRRKLRAVDDHDYIEAVWGIGFKLRL